MTKLKLPQMRNIFILALAMTLMSCSVKTAPSVNRFQLDWKYEQFSEPISIGVKGNDNYVACAGINGVELALIDESTGATVWHIEQDEKPTNAMNFPPLFAGTKLITYNSDKLKAWELKTGYNIWEFQSESTPLGPASFFIPAASGSRIFSGTASGFFYCIDAGSGFGAWREKNRFEGYGQSVTWNDKVISRTLGGKLEARNKATGKLIWKNENMPLPDDCLAIDTDNMYFAFPGSHIVAINPASGRYVYDIAQSKTPIKNNLKFSPRLDKDKLIVLENKYVTIYKKADGARMLNFELDFEPDFFEAFDDLCFFTFESKLFVFDHNGKKQFEFQDENEDSIGGVAFTNRHIITWSPRIIYALMRH